MALKPCHECGREISTEAKACPQCGAAPKMSTGAKVFGGIVGLLVFLFLVGLCSDPDLATPPVAESEDVVVDTATDAPVASSPSPSAAASPTTTPARSVASFSIPTYCESVSQAVGGSYSIRQTCVDQEEEARGKVNGVYAGTEARILNYCREVGQAVGGSYSIMETCIQQELAAR